MSASVLGREELVKNMSSWHERLVGRFATQIEIIQGKMVAHARKGHGKAAHASGRFVTRLGALEEAIQPGKIYITDTTVRGIVEARMPYASFVEARYPFIGPARDAYAAEFLTRIRKVAGEK
jgi:hypothetical protein